MEIMIELTEDQMDAVAGGQATATADITLSAAGPSTAAVTASYTISTSDTDGSKLASIMGSFSSTSD
jgi:hypothetical protein